MKTMQRIISFCLALYLAVSMVPVQVVAQEDVEGETLPTEEIAATEATETVTERGAVEETVSIHKDDPADLIPEETSFSEQTESYEENNVVIFEENLKEGTTDVAIVTSGSCGDNLAWMFDEDTRTLTISGTGEMYDFSDTGSPWYSLKADIEHVVISSGVTSIGNYAFASSGMVNIDIWEDVTSIGYCAFLDCVGLRKMEIPDSVTKIGSSALSGCSSIVSVELGNGITSIEFDMFCGCESLKTVTIGKSVNTLGNCAFIGCNALEKVYYGGTERAWNKMVLRGALEEHNEILEGAEVFFGSEDIVSFDDGNGTASDPYLVSNAEQLNVVRDDLKAHYVQTSDIDLAGLEWEPIGAYTDDEDMMFTGSYNGQKNKIRNMKITKMPETYRTVGLFGCNDGVLENIVLEETILSIETVVDDELTEAACFGGIVGRNKKTVKGCSNAGQMHVRAKTDLSFFVGGIVGVGTSSNCVNHASITAVGDGEWTVVACGGIVGHPGSVNGVIEACVNYGKVNGCVDSYDTQNQIFCGGITGEDGRLVRCVNFGDIAGRINTNIISSPSCCVGGLSGYTSAGHWGDEDIVDSINFGNIFAYSSCEGNPADAGGLFGDFGGGATNCYNLADSVYADPVKDYYGTDYSFVGRIAGSGGGEINSCYSLDSTVLGVAEPYDNELECGVSLLSKDQIYAAIEVILTSLGIELPDDENNLQTENQIRLLFKWDSEKEIAYFDSDPDVDFLNFGSQVTEETDKSFIANVDNLVGTYVLVETKARDDGMIAADILLSIDPLETKTGTVTAIGFTTITIDGVEYSIPENVNVYDLNVGDSIMYHLYNGDLVGINGKGSADDDNDDPAENIGTVRYYSDWDPESKTVTFGRDIMSMATVPENADPSLLNALDSLQGNYVLVEIKEQDGIDEVISILPVESIAGQVEYVSSIFARITIGGTEYPISSGGLVDNIRVDDYVLCHIHAGEVIAVEILQELTGKLMGWNKNTRVVSIALDNEPDLGTLGYSLSKLANKESVEFLNKLSSGSTTIVTDIQFICDEQGFVYRVENPDDDIESSDMKTVSVKYWDDLEDKEKTAQVNWGYPLFSEDARNIENADPESFAELVKISALLCQNTYGLAMREVLTQLGAENIEIMRSGQLDLSNPARSIAHVEFGQGNSQQTILIVAIRGTKTVGDWITDIAGAWAFDTGTVPKEHLGFSVAKNSIKNEIKTYLSENNIDASQSKILITGHSYGAAVANLLANSLEDVFDQRDIYAYTFAAPNNIVVTSSLVLGSNIHNFRNAWDPVVRIPVALLPIEKYTVFGQQHFFTLEGIGDDSEGVLIHKNHNCTHYVNYAFNLVEHNPIDSLETRYVQIHCPVDVTAYDENGKIVGRITDNQLDESFTTIMMYPVSDQKNIFIDQNDEVQLSIVATDSGTMDVIITDYDVVTGKVSAVKEYSDIGLKESKAFQTSIADEIATKDIELEVVDRKGKRLAVVNENGSETVDISEEHEHFTEMQNVKEATCTETGYSGDEVCSECGTVVKQGEKLTVTSHDYETTWSQGDANGHWHKCKNCSAHDTPVPHAPSSDVAGLCAVCGYQSSVPMHRMYDPNSGEHFYTGAEAERDFLVNAGWHYEGVGFNFPVEGAPVYRLYEPVYGEHIYTMDEAEKTKLMSWGWSYEGVAFNSAPDTEVPQYRFRNPNSRRGAYHFTSSEDEKEDLIAAGWIYEGIGWYSCWE